MNSNVPTFLTVVTICKNDLPGLEVTYASLRDQTFQDLEWIVIDGDSDDGTRNWLSETLGSENRYIWISEKDQGLYDAMNKGLTKASGRYLLFMNSGDYLANSNTLERINQCVVENGDPDFIYGDSIDITTDGQSLYGTARSHKTLWHGMFAHHQAMLFRRAALHGLRYRTQYSLSADYAFLCDFFALNNSLRVIYADLPICVFRHGGRHQINRRQGLIEDFHIRKTILHEPLIMCGLLYVKHALGHYLDQRIPWLMRALRYRNTS